MKKIILSAILILSFGLAKSQSPCTSHTMGITVAQSDTSTWVSTTGTVQVNLPKVAGMTLQLVAYMIQAEPGASYKWSNTATTQSIWYQIPTMNDNMVLVNGQNNFSVVGTTIENGNTCTLTRHIVVNVKNGANLTGVEEYDKNVSTDKVEYIDMNGRNVETIEKNTVYAKIEHLSNGRIQTSKFLVQ